MPGENLDYTVPTLIQQLLSSSPQEISLTEGENMQRFKTYPNLSSDSIYPEPRKTALKPNLTET